MTFHLSPGLGSMLRVRRSRKTTTRSRVGFNPAADYSLEHRHMLAGAPLGQGIMPIDSAALVQVAWAPAQITPLVITGGLQVAPATASTVSFSGFEYTQNATGITITRYTGNASELVVPQFLNGVKVTEIGAGALRDNTAVTRVVLSEGITRIGDYAFFGDLSLKSISLPSGLQSIGYAAFGNCISLSDVALPTTLSRLGDFAFTNCSSLTAMNVPEGITNIPWGAFRGCSSLSSVTLPTTTTSIAGQAFWGCGFQAIVIPASVTSIGHDVFTQCPSLRSVYMLGNAPTAGDHPFQDDFNVTAYYMPNTKGWSPSYAGIPTKPFVGQNSDYTFTITNTGITITKYIGKSTEVTVPQFINGVRVTELGIGAFQGRADITRVTLPQGLLKIGNNAFDGCGRLTSVNIPNGVTSIGDTAFIWCGSLKTLNIPASVKSIGIFWSFWGCGSLTAINVDRANTTYASQDGILYNKDFTWLFWCPGGKTGEVTLASTVRTIGYHSFQDCSGITKLTIPASVTLIEDGVFNRCTNLRSFHFLGNAPTVRSAFDPDVRATAYYLRGTTGWGATIGGIPTATTPSAPTLGLIALVGPGQGGISWKSPASNGGSVITGYVVQVRTTDGSIIRQVTLSANSTSYTATGLRNGVTYSFRVAATNAAGLGVWSSPLSITPGAPRPRA